MKQPQTLRVRWVDSGMHIDEGWAPTDVYRSRARDFDGTVITVGMLLYEDENNLVLGLSYDPAHDHWYGAQLIHKPNIIDRKVLPE